jgi:tetratricopeptide (TPR) repeat protein
MPRAFLSHSSKDKKFVESVSKELGFFAFIDSRTFEEGMGNLEEILRALDKTDLFVLFISDAALKSKWVQDELSYSKALFDTNQIKRIYPIIIDPTITYNDPRIPQWLQEAISIKPVLRIGKVIRLLRARLRELGWDKHPYLKQRDQLFVGRNEQLRKVEERLDDISSPTPHSLIASGFPKVGRKTFLKKSLFKANVLLNESFDFPLVTMNDRESIEDFIIKIYDLGVSEDRIFPDFLKTDLDEKVKIAGQLLLDVQKAKEIVLIDDGAGIVLADRTIAEWFKRLSTWLVTNGEPRITICIGAKFRIRHDIVTNTSNIFSVDIPELSRTERAGLLKRYAEISGINLSAEDLEFLLDKVNGFPGQIHYCIDSIKRSSMREVKKNIDSVIDYQKELFSSVINEIETNEESKDILTVLTEFDFISLDLLFDITKDKKQDDVAKFIDDLCGRAIVEYVGADKEYVRLNDGVRDFLLRADYKISPKYRAFLKGHIEEFVKNDSLVTSDISDFFYSLRGALINNYKFQSRLLLPSHYLKTMVFLYEREKKYSDVIAIADRVLLNESKIDEAIAIEIRYWLCLALARLKEERFKKDVQVFSGSDYEFLFGFYYRMIGKPEYAIEHFRKALNERPKFPRAQREMVQVLVSLELFSEALEYAKYNYENDRDNPFHIQAYFDCYIKSGDIKNPTPLLLNLISQLRKIKTRVAEEMASMADADYALYVENDVSKALKRIDYSIDHFGGNPHNFRRKFNILERMHSLKEMEQIVKMFEIKYKAENSNESYAMVIMKAKLAAYKGDKTTARNLINSSLSFYPDRAKHHLLKLIDGITS